MASRRRRNRPESPESAPRSAASDRSSQPPPSDDSSVFAAVPFYNTTFSTHRVSPLYIGKEQLTNERLRTLAQRLRDILVGDVVRGVEVGLGRDGDDPVMGRFGALEAVDMHWVRLASVLDINPDDAGNEHEGSRDLSQDHMDIDPSPSSSGGHKDLLKQKAMHISLRYEASSCTALLLPSTTQEDPPRNISFSIDTSAEPADPQHFFSMPLLLLRMPTPLKPIIADFLATSFDCRVSPLRLGTRSLVRSWEVWARLSGLPSRGPLAKDMVLSLGFHLAPPDQPAEEEDYPPPPGLKSIDVIIPAAELRKFADAPAGPSKRKNSSAREWEGDLKKRRKLAGGRPREEGWEWRMAGDATAGEGGAPTAVERQPFTAALGWYMDHHLGLDMFHPGVRVTKVACAGFAMSEGRLKVFGSAGEARRGASSEGQRQAVLELVADLVGKATIGGFEGQRGG
ncbi:kinetochore complex Sim4 subunit Fta1-domain-containing protein [Cercophora scortea]|uniref:Kinetochore complex Sim4 subunit Fta1-domain-containing protein n=1 Tax=Cercophora scortea TaxID=314031 RepID=A0AAE0M953_9PEZI|nr:kinetochore complex Sim4 subunit Fta1-domain-containing protein [Cercophora scortea]